MEKNSGGGVASRLFGTVATFMRGCMCRALYVAPIPNHIAFIMDVNIRYAKKRNLEDGVGHRAGHHSTLMCNLKYCYEMGVKYISVYTFSIDNFKRRLDEVQSLMDLLQEKIEELIKEESIVNQYELRLYFVGNLKLMNEPVRVAAENAMMVNARNTKATLLICMAYSSTDEIVHAFLESCQHKWD